MTEKQLITRLRVLALNQISQTLPYRESFIHKYQPATANGLTRCIIDWIKFSGGQAERISVTGRMVDNTKVVSDVMGHRRIIGSVSYLKSSMTKGSADISATIRGKSVKIEIKIGHDRQSDAQKEYQATVEKAGGTYLIVRTLSDFVQWWDETQEPGMDAYFK
jgi:hypothetical protein